MRTASESARLEAGLSGALDERAVIATAQARLIRHHAAMLEVALERVSRQSSPLQREREMPIRSIAAELGFASHEHDATAQKDLNDAYSLVTRFGATVDALEAARISMKHVRVIHAAGTVIDDDAARGAWEQVVLEFAARQTPGRTKAYARELAERLNPVGMTERHARANEHRDVSVLDLDDGMSYLQVLMESTRAHAIRDRLTQQARLIRHAANAERRRRGIEPVLDSVLAPDPDEAAAEAAAAAEAEDADIETCGCPAEVIDDVRTIGQIRSDLVADMLLVGSPAIDPVGDRSPGGLGAIRGHVQVVVPVTTMTKVTDAGASLNGVVPIDPETARRLAGDAPGWDRVLCDPITGTVREVDRYSPRADQRRFVQAKDMHCRGVGCRQPAHRCQIDHNHEAHDGGATDLCNLACLCTRHHTLKTETEWTARQLPNGDLEFTSPLGNTYVDEVPRRVMFVPDGDPPPF